MARKILFCATVDIHFQAFHLPVLEWFKRQGWEVHVAAAGNLALPHVDRKIPLAIRRSPLDRGNIHAYRQLRDIIDGGDYAIVHCHTPMGGVLARLAARSARMSGTRVIYTAHGFHFCKGAPLLNWLLYYPIEKRLAGRTDCLITINEEDYGLARGRGFKAGRIDRVHGVGVDTERFCLADPADQLRLRRQNGYAANDFLLFCAAEFNANKNQQLLIRAIASLRERLPGIKLLLAGEGPLLERCRELARSLGVMHAIDFLGYRSDIDRLLPMCDVSVSSSLREGLPVNILEAMACGLPIVAAANRGHRELIRDGANGYIVDPRDPDALAEKLMLLGQSEELRRRFGERSREIVRSYSAARVARELEQIYAAYMTEERA